ncbi:hypothetical protein JGI1_02311 [Candidatus Thermokryptus mobilis]|uniref:O-antigen ligase like membrane protein n=1 Tax=Candidatus Thermokryptus mobilis TaxID=1643428 RepID=A0A0S4NED7_9BACT|nr:hypothetical protein [Candidatus Thermokryptus mobilis]CUU09301.1 hypothetical protein JGI1_02311 [Candidatus Thermokryptus mobilis]
MIESGKKKFYLFLLSLIIFSLQFETLPLPVKVQIIPLTSILVFFYIVFMYERVALTPVFATFFIFFIYVTLHSIVALNVDIISNLGEPIRFISWVRQFLALISGFLIFKVLRYLLRYVDIYWVSKRVVIFSLLSIMIGILNFIWGFLNVQIAGELVKMIRSFIAPYGYISPIRSSGLSLEPSHFAGFIVIIILPALLIYWRLHKKRAILILLFVTLSFFWTFSMAGFVLLFLFTAFAIVLGPQRKYAIIAGFWSFLLFIFALFFFPNTQIIRHLSTMIIGNLSISIIDRFYSTFGPFLNLFSSFNVIGYGLGSSVYYLSEMIPKDLYIHIISVRWKELPSLGTLVGRIFAETGIIGLFLFFSIFAIGYSQINKLIKFEKDKVLKTHYKIVRLGYILSFISLFFLFGSFHQPYFWFWLAIIDSMFIKNFPHYLYVQTS